MSNTDRFVTLSSGAEMPMIGLGTWNASPATVGPATEYALTECGYRHIDCAYVYHNEKEIGQALKNIFKRGLLKREEIFITSKLWNTFHAKNNVLKTYKNTLHDLKLDYLDLYLMHFGIAIAPGKDDEPLDEKGYVVTEKVPIRETWEAMEDLVKEGLVRSIGVSNFTAPLLLDLLSYSKISPAVNQIELHPYLQQSDLVEFCHYKNIAVTAYSPLGSPGGLRSGDPVLLEDKTLRAIAKNHGKSPAQILIRWALQRNTIVIPKSTNPENIKNNIAVFDFEISKEEMGLIKTLDRKFRFVNPKDWWRLPYFD